MEYPILNINVQQARPAEAGLISEIGKISFYHTFESVFKNKEEMKNYVEETYSVEKIQSGLQKNNNIFLLGYADGEPVGFAKLKCNSSNSQLDYTSQTQLQKLYVLPSYLGLGIGLHLLKVAKQIALSTHSDCLWLDVIIENHKAIRFYEKNGFVKKGKHEFMIGTQLFRYHVMLNSTVTQ